MTAVWEIDLPHSEKLLLLALADNANDEGHCWPSIETLARKCSIGRRTVIRGLAVLENARHITRSSEVGKSNSYNVHPCQPDTSAKLAPVPQRHGGSASVARVPVPSRHPTSANLTPRTVIEPSVEPSENLRTKSANDLPNPVPRGAMAKIRSLYPGVHLDVSWLQAERVIEQLLESGTPVAELVAAAGDYGMQQKARGNMTHLFTPLNFFSKGIWKGPFTIPKSKAEVQQDTNIEAGLKWLQGTA